MDDLNDDAWVSGILHDISYSAFSSWDLAWAARGSFAQYAMEKNSAYLARCLQAFQNNDVAYPER